MEEQHSVIVTSVESKGRNGEGFENIFTSLDLPINQLTICKMRKQTGILRPYMP
jgi:hypothetical protein